MGCSNCKRDEENEDKCTELNSKKLNSKTEVRFDLRKLDYGEYEIIFNYKKERIEIIFDNINYTEELSNFIEFINDILKKIYQIIIKILLKKI